ncbi:hypothetical protein EZV62_014686 [Acer yangbiense]|uniref:Reverse transcriptase zinc-binding domain-containing protein n=1 Tax=Acer yangbiense TaxID=1000413 RepID=A0A5C7HSN8_9ROSI|nr:hypothetical protein EZV62_014686 [Acer yangbiense]
MDSWLWHFDKKGTFFVRSAYKVAWNLQNTSEASSSSVSPSWWKRLWLLNLPCKVKIFLWKACREILPTKLLLFKRGIADSFDCNFCGDHAESVDHALWGCVRVKRNQILYGGGSGNNGSVWEKAVDFVNHVNNTSGVSFVNPLSSVVDRNLRWKASLASFFKLNVDAAVT